eukprot:CAMPEP_0116135264 /NCGR_PEP_ID=MMETSP0329-20121206/11098_1 /TAXON_ID=697910 /ORGANISM="Pseudo-nitzschia arenysensis, Strain B593" /LENGTH=485 /DNA_ID=CAMNT_0003630053 /DNA_START=38 /DNA_END=1495 /DNA_ORIENTATION=-
MPFKTVFKQNLLFVLLLANAMLATTMNRSRSFVSALSATASPKMKVGIIRLDDWGNTKATGTGSTDYVPITGDIDDGRSYNRDFGVVATVVTGCSWDALKDTTKWEEQEHLNSICDNVAKAFVRLMKENVDVIVANCGLFMWLHAKGIATPAMDIALKEMGDALGQRPMLSLSTLTTLPNYIALYGIGAAQKEAIEKSKEEASKAIIAIFTSNEEACMGILEATPQIKGTNVFSHSEALLEENNAKGGILVVGLNGKDVVGTGMVDGFEIVNDGTAAYYDTLNPAMEKVAVAVKEKYPNVAMGLVECTEVSAYTDTIRETLNVPVVDPIIMTTNLISSFLDHDYAQLGKDERHAYVEQVLDKGDDKTDFHYRDAAWILHYVEKKLEKNPKWLRPLRKKYCNLIDGKISGVEAKKVCLTIVEKLRKVSGFKLLDHSKEKMRKQRFWADMEQRIESTDPEKVTEILNHVKRDMKYYDMEEDMIIRLV